VADLDPIRSGPGLVVTVEYTRNGDRDRAMVRAVLLRAG
jgi:hypothetical protein